MECHLVVVVAFGNYKVGDKVTDEETVEFLLNSEDADKFVKIPVKEV